MNGSYNVPTGSSFSPNNGPARPRAASMMNRLFSAMPSSICWPVSERAHFCAETTFSVRKISSRARRLKMPRWFTQAPRLVETVTSGEVETMRPARSLCPLPRAFRIWPKAACVEIRSAFTVGKSSGTATAALCLMRLPGWLKGALAIKSRSLATGRSRSSSASHSAPSAMPIWLLKLSICSTLISPA